MNYSMNSVEIDGVTHDVSLFSQEGQQIFAVLLENNKRLQEAEVAVAIYKASAITLIERIKKEAVERYKEEPMSLGAALASDY
tara:strand:+ start:178 stop:426 length:249 start_codon:yes stop_codon:yes gene_type:complete